MIDLHTHSTFSDGSLTPEELAGNAIEAGLTAMALTDHDSTDGLPRFVEACRGSAVEAIPGVEISIDTEKNTMHMLGYFMDLADAHLQDSLVKLRAGRKFRNEQILKLINGLGFKLEWDEVAALAGGDVVGRIHFALAMISKGYVADKDAAFGKYLGKDKPCYANRYRLSDKESIDLIHSAGGVAVLAHPFTLKMGNAALRKTVAELKDKGLDGIETYYPEHSPGMFKEYLGLANEFDLVPTGGSDFHGKANPDIKLGKGFGNLNIPDDIVGKLKGRIKKRNNGMTE